MIGAEKPTHSSRLMVMIGSERPATYLTADRTDAALLNHELVVPLGRATRCFLSRLSDQTRSILLVVVTLVLRVL